jgi:uncharacterized membrane protein YgcG
MRTRRRWFTAVGGVLALALAGLGLLSTATTANAKEPVGPAKSHLHSTAPRIQRDDSWNFLVTLYGWPDNSPPGDAIAYPRNEGYPTTYATDQNELPVGTIVYYPYLHRYFINEDDCTECDEDWTGQGPDGGPNLYHIDLWIGGQGGDSNSVINCEDNLTQNSAEVVVNPPSDEPVDTTPLYDSSSNTCYDPSSFTGGGSGGGGSGGSGGGTTGGGSGGGSGGGGGTCAAAWSSGSSYVPGDVVSYQGDNYTATYYSTDVTPGSAIAWNIWKNSGACTG